MQFRFTLVPVAAALLLAGCGSSTSASKDNFAKAIHAELAKPDRCIVIDPGLVQSSDATYPLKVESMKTDSLDALVKAGLLTVADTQVPAMFGGRLIPGKAYSLTGKGKSALRSGRLFCAGHYKVAEVVNYTVPGKEMDGTTGSEVNFTYVPTDVPSWATSDAIKAVYPDFYKNVSSTQPRKGQADLVLMSDGWQAPHVSLGYASY